MPCRKRVGRSSSSTPPVPVRYAASRRCSPASRRPRPRPWSKLGKSQTNFFTIADLLKQRGYDTSFIYGGESHFDNMRSFFLGNGFTTIVEQKDFKNPVFEGSWGASDEDLMAKANETFAALHKEGKPFFSLVFSSSNHDPFGIPRQPHRPVRAAQADPQQRRQVRGLRRRRVLQEGQGIGLLEGHPVPGHRRSRQPGRGASLVPIPASTSRGHSGDGIAPRKDPRIVSQIDMAPTLLSLMGISADYPMLGKDLTRMPADWPGRAIMQYDKNFALMRGKDVVILQPERAPEGFIYEDATETLTPAPQPGAMKDAALGLVLWGQPGLSAGGSTGRRRTAGWLSTEEPPTKTALGRFFLRLAPSGWGSRGASG